MPFRIFTDKEKARIDLLLLENVRVHVIAEEIGCSDQPIYGIRRRNLERKRESDPDYVILRSKILELRKIGRNSAQIAIKLRRRLKVINEILKRQNIITESETEIRGVSL